MADEVRAALLGALAGVAALLLTTLATLQADGIGSRMSRPIVAALALVAVSAGAAFAFVAVRGGLGVPMGTGGNEVAGVTGSPAPSPSQIAATSPTARVPTARSPTAPAPTAAPAATTAPVPLTPTPTPAATPQPTAVSTPPPTAAPTRAPPPTSDRYSLLRPCSGQSDCWIYTVRPGDNLYSIGIYFGHSLDTVYRLNPWARTTPLRPGQQLVLPPPRR